MSVTVEPAEVGRAEPARPLERLVSGAGWDERGDCWLGWVKPASDRGPRRDAADLRVTDSSGLRRSFARYHRGAHAVRYQLRPSEVLVVRRGNRSHTAVT